MLKKKESPKIDEAVSKSVNFEVTIADMARRSERRAWWVASASLVVSLCLVGGYFYILPLKEKVPYLIMADAYTGTSSLSRLTEDVTNRRLAASEAINRSNITHFVMARESYDYNMIMLRDWDTVMTMSSSKLATAYMNLHAPENPGSPYKQYGRDRAIRIKVTSIVLIPGDAPGDPPQGATVRFQRTVYNKINGATSPLDNKIATMAFVYKPNLKMDDRYRVENPLGFQVLDYRVDSDYADTPPGEVAVDPSPAAAAPTPAVDGAMPAPTVDTSGTNVPPTQANAPAAQAAPTLQQPVQPTVQPNASAPAGGRANGVRR